MAILPYGILDQLLIMVTSLKFLKVSHLMVYLWCGCHSTRLVNSKFIDFHLDASSLTYLILTYIFNLIFTSSTFPCQWKHTSIIHQNIKSLVALCLTDYRSIWILLTISKVSISVLTVAWETLISRTTSDSLLSARVHRLFCFPRWCPVTHYCPSL